MMNHWLFKAKLKEVDKAEKMRNSARRVRLDDGKEFIVTSEQCIQMVMRFHKQVDWFKEFQKPLVRGE